MELKGFKAWLTDEESLSAGLGTSHLRVDSSLAELREKSGLVFGTVHKSFSDEFMKNKRFG